MSEKRYFKVEYDGEWYLFDSTTISEQLVKEQAEYGYGVFANSLSPSEVVDLLNKMSDEIEEVEISIKLFEDDVQNKDNKILEQQSTINELQSIINHIKCEENCEDYDYCCETVCSLYNEIKHLKEENASLKQRIRDIKYNNCD